MKKILIAVVVILSVVGYSCKKEKGTISQQVTPSKPTVNYSGSLFFSIPTGGSLPPISATAYDTVIGESYPANVDNSTFDNTKPGLYVVAIKATNKYGYVGKTYIYVAVTDVPTSADISGLYMRTNGITTNVTKVANGLYRIDNVGGSTLIDTAYFAHLNDTTIDFGVQPIADGTLQNISAKLSIATKDTFQYKLNSESGFNPDVVRKFIQQ